MIEPKGYLIEIFKGIQGEGPWIGESQIFLRFAGCNLSCKYCDTAYALNVPRQYKIADKYCNNPVTLVETIDIVKSYGSFSTTVSITGGEPLLQDDYLKMLLPALKKEGYTVYLETNATLPKQLAKILQWVDIVSADIKLPSFTGESDIPKEHQEFLHVAREKNLFVKVVVTDETIMDEISMAVDIIRGIDMNIPLIIQPDIDSSSVPFSMEANERLLKFHNYARTRLPNVRLLPQMHKLMGWK
ncbi:7-carboxy-7-deazaguanine synthase QueE [Candidatus Desantisbacteria bacterium]|nr:7-carboxy-7-deazaguanine synthase QueE [Candidatus Desantisbacteria bacterium]